MLLGGGDPVRIYFGRYDMALETKIRMKLLDNHEHGGIKYAQHEIISVSPSDANILINMGKAEKFVEQEAKASPNKQHD